MGASSAFNANEIQLANIRDTLAQTNERNVLNQQRIQQLMMGQRAMQGDLRLQQVLQDQSGSVSQPPVPVGQYPSSTPAIVDQSPSAKISADINDMIQQRDRWMKLSAVPDIPSKSAIEFRSKVDSISKDIAAANDKLVEEQRKAGDYIAGAAGGADRNNPESLQLAYSQIVETSPRLAAKLGLQLDSNGHPLPTNENFTRMESAAKILTKRSDQLADAQRVTTDRRIVANEAANLEERRYARADLNQRAAAAQMGLDQRSEEGRQDRLANREILNSFRQSGQEQTAQTQAERIANDYKTDKQVQEFAEHKKAVTTGVNYVFNADGTPKPELGDGGWKNHDSARDFMLSRQFMSVVHPSYRGSLADIKQLSTLSNLPEKLGKMIASVAAGATLAQSDRVNMVNAMREVLASENKDQVVREDQNFQKLQRLKLPEGTDPSIYVTPYALRSAKEAAVPIAAAKGQPIVDYTMLGGENGVKVQGRGSKDSPYQITNDTEYAALPKGAIFRHPDGSLRTKP